MKSLYSVSIADTQGRMTVLNIVALTMAAAVTAAQARLSVTTEPQCAQKLSDIDFEV